MTVYRITKKRYAEDLSGQGSKLYGGRWNSKGVPVIYTSEHRSLCLLEMLVHTSIDVIPMGLVLVEITLPESIIPGRIKLNELPRSWKGFPYDHFTRQIGDELLKSNKHVAIQVPSALVEEEYNILINPNSENMSGITISQIKNIALDSRLFSE